MIKHILNVIKSLRYGHNFILKLGEKIVYPNFTLTFIGEREEAIPRFVGGMFIYYDYEISDGFEKKTLSWTMGTGLIMPMQFEFKEKYYVLRSDGLKLSISQDPSLGKTISIT